METIYCTYEHLEAAFGKAPIFDGSGWTPTIWNLTYKKHPDDNDGLKFSIYNEPKEPAVPITKDMDPIEWTIDTKEARPEEAKAIIQYVDQKIQYVNQEAIGQNSEEVRMLQQRAGIKRG